MKESKLWIWMGCLFLGLTLAASTSEISQSCFIWFPRKIINSTYSSSGFIQRNQHDRSDYYHTVTRPTNETGESKRSIKRGEVNYFENLKEHSKFRNRQKIKKYKIKTPLNDPKIHIGKYKEKYSNFAKMIAMFVSQIPTKTLTRLVDEAMMKKGTSKSHYFSDIKFVHIQMYNNSDVLLMENLLDRRLLADSWQRTINRIKCTWRRLRTRKTHSRHRRMANDPRKKTVQNKKERKHQIHEETHHHRMGSAARREKIRNEEHNETKARRWQLKDSGKPLHGLRVREKPDISEKMRENWEKISVHVPNRSRSSSLKNTKKRVITRGTAVKAKSKSSAHSVSKYKGRLNEKVGKCGQNCRKSIIRTQYSKCTHPLGKNCVTKGREKNHKHSSIATAERKRIGSAEKSTSRTSTGVGNKTIGKGRKHPEQVSKDKSHDGQREMDIKRRKKMLKRNHKKSRKGDGVHKGNTGSKTGTLETHKGAGESLFPTTLEVEAENEHSAKKTQRKKHHESKKKRHKVGSKNEKRNKKKKKNHDEEDPDNMKVKRKKGTKALQSKIKTSTKHTEFLSEGSDEGKSNGKVISGKNKHKKQEEKEDLETLEMKDVENKTGEFSRTEKSSQHMAINNWEKQGKITTLTKESTRKSNEPLENSTKDVRTHTGRTNDSKHGNEIQYLGHVLGFGLGKRKPSRSNSQVWSWRVHKRPMTAGFASFGRLTRAMSNLYGASASAALT